MVGGAGILVNTETRRSPRIAVSLERFVNESSDAVPESRDLEIENQAQRFLSETKVIGELGWMMLSNLLDLFHPKNDRVINNQVDAIGIPNFEFLVGNREGYLAENFHISITQFVKKGLIIDAVKKTGTQSSVNLHSSAYDLGTWPV